MILSSADILRILGGSEIVRLSARLRITDGKPSLSGAEGLFIHIDRFPEVDEFEATWSIYVESDGSEPDDIVLEEIKRLLPNVKVSDGLLVKITTTDFLTGSTQLAPAAPVAVQVNTVPDDYEERFQGLLESVQDQMLLVNSGQRGKDGTDGRDGLDGRDGKDILATETELEDLSNVEEGLAREKGQVLTWDGTKWTNLFIPQFSTPGAASDGGGSSGAGPGKIKVQERAGAAGSPENPVDDVTTLSFNTNNGFSVTDLGGGEALVNLGSAFAPWHVDGQETLVPEGEEPVEFVAGAGIQITTNPNTYPQQITITSTGGGGGGGGGTCDGILDGGNADDGTSNGVHCPDPGIEEAPIDGKQYARQDADWTEVAPGGIEEAPQDGGYYVRQNGSWISLALALADLEKITLDGGNFTTDESVGTDEIFDGGSFS